MGDKIIASGEKFLQRQGAISYWVGGTRSAQIKKLVAAGVYLDTSDFVRDAIRDKLAAIKVIKYRDVDYKTAKKEVMGYFQERARRSFRDRGRPGA